MFSQFSPRSTVVGCWMFAMTAVSASNALADLEEDQRLVRDAVGVATELRHSESIYDQFTGAGTLVEIGDKEALQFLADSLSHPDWVIMRSAIDTLLNVQHPDGVNLIYRYSEIVEDSIFMKFLSESLASRPRDDMAEFLMASTSVDDPWVGRHALQALAGIALDDKEKRMRAIAEDTERHSSTRAYAYFALMDTAARPESLKKLIEIATYWGPDAQEAAAVGLGMTESAETIAALKHLRKAKSYKVQIAAMASEAGFGNEEALDALVQIMAHGKGLDPSVAAASIRRLPVPIAAKISQALIDCCKLNSDVATRMIESWASIEGDATLIYDWGLGNDNPDIRMQAVWLVGARADSAYIERLKPFLQDTDSGIRGMAAWAIVRILGDRYEPGVEI